MLSRESLPRSLAVHPSWRPWKSGDRVQPELAAVNPTGTRQQSVAQIAVRPCFRDSTKGPLAEARISNSLLKD